MAIRCCYKCLKRNVGCHSTCKDYIDEKKAEDERKEHVRKLKEKERDIHDFELHGHDRYKKHK